MFNENICLKIVITWQTHRKSTNDGQNAMGWISPNLLRIYIIAYNKLTFSEDFLCNTKALTLLGYLILTIILWGKYYDYFTNTHFTSKETES